MRKLSQEEFINRANKVHNSRYDYSSTTYTKMDNMIDIICPIHGIFQQSPRNHLAGHGCHFCSPTENLTQSQFIEKAREVHGDKYDYSKVVFNNRATLVTIECPYHGEFTQVANIHLAGSGCPKCGRERVKKIKSFTLDQFIEKAREVHGDKYDYSKVVYKNNKTKICIICPEHGEFWQVAHGHLKGNGCPICKESHGERAVGHALDKLGIKYTRGHRFPDCKYKKPLPFDFYISDYKTCIEFDGRQHYFAYSCFGGEKQLACTKIKDSIKTNYCKEKGIHLIRIKYSQLSSINKIINNYFSNKIKDEDKATK